MLGEIEEKGEAYEPIVASFSHSFYTGSVTSPLISPDVLIVFAQAQAGLGHLRVTDALYHGLPEGIHPILLNAQDKSVTFTHTITSRHIAGRWLMEVIQRGTLEGLFTRWYRVYLRSQTKTLKEQIRTILDEHITHPKTLLVVATHFGLAHQISSINDEIAKTYGMRVILLVIVTDDTAIKLWAVGGADRIFVPSEKMKRALEAYHRSQSALAQTTYEVLPYMVSPRLAESLSPSNITKRENQLAPKSTDHLHIAIPISGAAVQLSYMEHLIGHIANALPQARFHIVSLFMPATHEFLSRYMGKDGMDLRVSESAKTVIELYEAVYHEHVIALEITKPSEQSFKALIDPKKRGGSILLFSDPVGRQEEDNLAFLDRHSFIPSPSQQRELWERAAKHQEPTKELLELAHSWRGLRLPHRSLAGAQFVAWCKKEEIFASMLHFVGYAKHPELSDDGVAQFWKRVEAYLREA